MESKKKNIVDHVKRLEGQLRVVREELEKTNPDCVRASQTLLSSARSFAGLREKFVETFLLEHIVDEEKLQNKETFTHLFALIKG